MRYSKAIAAVFAAVFTVSGSPQELELGAPAAAFPKPDRPVADIVSPIWHDEKERDAAGEPRQVLRFLGIKSGMTIGDIGAGSGYYVVRLSPIVGPRGRLIAEDVVPEYLRGLRRRVRDLGLQNVTISLGEPHDPRLPADFARRRDPGAHVSRDRTALRAALQSRPSAQAWRARRHCRRLRADVRARYAAKSAAL